MNRRRNFDKDVLSEYVVVLRDRAKLIYTLNRVYHDVSIVIDSIQNQSQERKRELFDKILRLSLATFLIPDPIISSIIRCVISLTGYTIVNKRNEVNLSEIFASYQGLLDEILKVKREIC